MRRLREALGDLTLLRSDSRGVSPDAVEAVCFALLAWGTLIGQENNLPGVTGAKEAVCLGNITPGREFRFPDEAFPPFRVRRRIRGC